MGEQEFAADVTKDPESFLNFIEGIEGDVAEYIQKLHTENRKLKTELGIAQGKDNPKLSSLMCDKVNLKTKVSALEKQLQTTRSVFGVVREIIMCWEEEN